ncbi:MAG: peptide-methionine (S)-S-oxide reductase MsrA [Chloroflexi bacterium]|nr:peptide-methionine (S)-S-oxide reductase MsrA [Chloroflexota bacterium]MDA1217830.1 peptide-methionine (S)-S-oxide reductase MsrA [Chloroflexota bacterium]
MEMKEEIAVFGGGCFWCTEAVFSELKGVQAVNPGYAGGHTENPTYRQVCAEHTGHAEVIEIRFDPDQITYNRLLEVFFATHDPTTLNRQGADRGTSYRSIILYTNEDQKKQAEAIIKELDSSGSKGSAIVTEVAKLERFYMAEDDHKQYYLNNPAAMYCQVVIRPKVDKVRGEFASDLRSVGS